VGATLLLRRTNQMQPGARTIATFVQSNKLFMVQKG
jgi:hypothetical protein